MRGRVDYKIAVLCYKAVKLQQPSYLNGLLSSYRQSRVLRSSTSDLLSTQSSSTNIAARRFSCCAPTVWNSLPSFVRTADSFTIVLDLSSRVICSQHICSLSAVRPALTKSFGRCKFVTYLKTSKRTTINCVHCQNT